MKTKSTFLKLLFLFLFTIILVNCASPDIKDEVALEEKNENELLEKNENLKTYLIDKETSDRPGNQGGN